MHTDTLEISHFDDMLKVAQQQVQPQRLLFVFAGARLPDDATPEQRERFLAGEGGELAPLMTVDKAPPELAGFAALLEESRQFGHDWAIVFVAALSGRNGRAPSPADAEAALEKMIEAIKRGAFQAYVPFDRNGRPVHFG